MLSLPSPWLTLGVVVAVGAAGAAGYYQGHSAGENVVQVEFTQWKLTAEENRILADRAERNEEQRRQDVANKEAQDANQKFVQARADAVIANAAAGKLHDQLAAYIAAVRRASQDPISAPGSKGESSADPLDLLAKLYGRSDDAAGAIGEYADNLAVAGTACERISDGLQPPEGKAAP